MPIPPKNSRDILLHAMIPMMFPELRAVLWCADRVRSMLEYADEMQKKGFEHGYRKGCVDAARKFSETVAQHTAKICGMYALGLYMALMDGEFDKDDAAVIVEVLGSPKMQPEYVQAELDNMLNNMLNKKQLDMKVITQKYLNEINAEGLKDCDIIIKEFVEAFRRRGRDVSSFYTKNMEALLQ